MKRILIVDDSAFMRLSLKTILVNNGFDVVGEAENGLKAIEMYRTLKPDIVTMDITMPQMEGTETLEQIMKIDSNATVIMVSALGQETKVKQAIMLGAKGFIVKPFKQDYLLEALKKF